MPGLISLLRRHSLQASCRLLQGYRVLGRWGGLGNPCRPYGTSLFISEPTRHCRAGLSHAAASRLRL